MPSFCATRSVVSNWEPNLRTYRVTYRVTMDSESDGPQSVLSYMATQGYLVRSTTYLFGNDVDSLATLINIGAPRRAGGDKLKLIWLVDGTYEFNLDNLPPFRPVKIEPYFVQSTRAIESANYSEAWNRVNGEWVGPKAFAPGKETYKNNQSYPIGNSSNVPILPAPERESGQAAYRVSWLKQTALDAAFYIGTWNNQAFTLQTFTAIYRAPGIAPQISPTFFKTFAPTTLRLRDVQQPIRNIYGQDWFEVTLEFIEDDSFYLYELDRGFSARAKAGDSDGRGGTYSEGDFPEGSSGQREITDADGQPVSEPVLLDGTGKPLREQSESAPAIYLRWFEEMATNFLELNIGNWQ